MSWSPEDHIRHFMYEDIYQILKNVQSFSAPNRKPVVLDFGSKWYGDSDGGWQTHMRTMFKSLVGKEGFEHVLATYPEYDIERLTLSDNMIDVLVADQVLEHVQRPWKAALEICRVVRQGGIAMVATPGFYPVHPSPLDCWRIMHDGYRVLFPETLWEPLTLSAWGSAERVGFEYSLNKAFPYGPPETTVEQATSQPFYHADYDGRCPLMFWFVGRRTHVRPPREL